MNKRGRLTVKYRSLKRYEVGVTLEEHNRKLTIVFAAGKEDSMETSRWQLESCTVLS